MGAKRPKSLVILHMETEGKGREGKGFRKVTEGEGKGRGRVGEGKRMECRKKRENVGS